MRENESLTFRQVSKQRHIARLAIDIVCSAYDLTPDMILRRSRCQAHVSFARQVAIYLGHVVGQLSIAQLAQEFDRDRSTIAHACHMVEDRRDSPIFEQQMEILENDYQDQLINLYRNWFSESVFHRGQTHAAG